MRDVIITYRRVLVVVVHLFLWTASILLAIGLRFEFNIPHAFWRLLPGLVAMSLVVRSIVHWRFGLFHGLWRYSGSKDLRGLLQAATISSVLFAACWAFTVPQSRTFPRSVFVLDWAFAILIVGGMRFSIRTLREVSLQGAAPESNVPRKRLLLIGAGDAGEMLLREIVRSHSRRYEPVGFLDDNAAKHKERIHGVPVLGPITSVGEVAARLKVDEIILAIPSLSGQEVRRIVEMCRPTGAHLRTVPGVDGLIDGRVTVSQLSDVKIEDLLGRESVTLDTQAIAEFVHGRVVLVTGAGGSIGSELCRQVRRFGPARLLLVEQAENNLFEIERSLRAEGLDVPIVPYIGDICDTKRMEGIFASEKPNVVFHAAAHKHVPMMENNPGEAIKNNVFGTRKLADISVQHGVEKFVMVSTDKAVNPTSVMGVSKRVAEIYVQSLSQRSSTQFVTVRFGNVLGSTGSVVPIFKEQIAKGGPISVTHPEMTRYFMTIPEACQLIMQAGAMGKGGEIFVLDMGEPVKIVDLARDLIRLSGLDPERDIEIKFTGIRPGEKLFEELAVDSEAVDKTKHPKIFVGKFRPYELERVEAGLEKLSALSNGNDKVAIKTAFKDLVPEYATPVARHSEPPAPDAKDARSATARKEKEAGAMGADRPN